MDRLTLAMSKSHVIGLPTHQNCVNALPIISQDGGCLGTRHQPIDRIIFARNIVVQAVRDAESNLSHDHVPEPESRQWIRRPAVGAPLERGVRRRLCCHVHEGHCPAGGCQSSTLLPSGSMTHPNFPYSESSVFSSTSQPSSRSA